MKIHEEAKKGHIEAVLRELNAGVAVDARDPSDDPKEGPQPTPLSLAVSNPNCPIDLIRLLIDRGADVNSLWERDPVLITAIPSWDIAKIALLLDYGADIGACSKGGYDVLTSCIYTRGLLENKKLLEMLSFLIQRGATLGVSSEYGESALCVASRRGRFDAVKLLLDAGTDPSPLKWTELHRAVAIGKLEEVCDALDSDLEAVDRWNRTAWLLSFQVGDIEVSQLLEGAGSNTLARDYVGKTALLYALEFGHLDSALWLINEGFDVNEADDDNNTPLNYAAGRGHYEMVDALLSAGAKIQPGDMKSASTPEIMGKFLSLGCSMNDASEDLRRTLTGVKEKGLEGLSKEDFDLGRDVQFGSSNPEQKNIPFWNAMITARTYAWAARQLFEVEKDLTRPVWCYSRYGQSIIELPDGRVVEIGGEHEDSYDPDFCIYNDVVVYDRLGGFTVYEYPREIFPPTDFHSSSFYEDGIYIIGSLGYMGQRDFGRTPIYRLDINDFHIEAVESTGDNPGWISRHRVRFLDSHSLLLTGGKISTAEDYSDNPHEFTLDLRTMAWQRLEE